MASQVVCRACEKELDSTYTARIVNATEKVVSAYPDGSCVVTWPESVATCSWACLGALIQAGEVGHDPKPTAELF